MIMGVLEIAEQMKLEKLLTTQKFVVPEIINSQKIVNVIKKPVLNIDNIQSKLPNINTFAKSEVKLPTTANSQNNSDNTIYWVLGIVIVAGVGGILYYEYYYKPKLIKKKPSLKMYYKDYVEQP